MMFCMIRGGSLGRGQSKIAFGGLLALAALFASGSDVYAQAFKVFGFATDVAPPLDFVTKTRPTGNLDYIPVFEPPPEPSRPSLKTDELKAVKSDLDSVGKHHDTLRQGFPPAAKALAEQQAGQKKPSSNAPGAQQ
jgi:hypothetical protein